MGSLFSKTVNDLLTAFLFVEVDDSVNKVNVLVGDFVDLLPVMCVSHVS